MLRRGRPRSWLRSSPSIRWLLRSWGRYRARFPELLVKGAADEHSYALHPSDARALARADLIVWVGPNLEGFMERPLETLAPEEPANWNS